jgi:L-threonylcarbamoyladenylate synthase
MSVLDATGPLLAPSANIEGHEPAENIEQAVSYFDDTVAVYVDSGPITNSLPSKIIAINDDDEIEIIRD